MNKNLNEIRKELNALAELRPEAAQVIAIAEAVGLKDPELIFRAAVQAVYGKMGLA